MMVLFFLSRVVVALNRKCKCLCPFFLSSVPGMDDDELDGVVFDIENPQDKAKDVCLEQGKFLTHTHTRSLSLSLSLSLSFSLTLSLSLSLSLSLFLSESLSRLSLHLCPSILSFHKYCLPSYLMALRRLNKKQ